MKQSKAIMTLAVVAVMLMATPSFADSVTLANANLVVNQGGTVTFSGTYTGEDVVGDVIHWTGASPCQNLDPNACVDDTAFILTATPGNFSSFFDVFVDLNVAPGTYFGEYFVLNDAGDLSQPAEFSVTVNTPEPASLMLLGSGLVGAAGALRRKILG